MVKKAPRVVFVSLVTAAFVAACAQAVPSPETPDAPPPSVWRDPRGSRSPAGDTLMTQSREAADAKSKGCLVCHQGIEKDHAKLNVQIGCTDCHGGDATAATKAAAHVPGLGPPYDGSRATDWLDQPFAYVRFVNPGDLRVVDTTCGLCHPNEAAATKKSMMATGAMLWGAALYNNGSFPLKRPHFGEAYDERGRAVRVQTVPPPDDAEVKRGVIPYLDPLPRYNVTQMGNLLRTFERGGKRPLELGNPDKDEDPGLPARRLSQRGLGTLLRTDPVFLGLTKTRLLDPVLWMPGTNDHPGDYRGSGCTACHMIYANDRDPVHSGSYAQFGNRGRSKSGDKTIPKDEDGHPITHQLTRAIPSSQCMVCHMHPGTNMVTTYFGDLWYDNETDAKLLYKAGERSAAERHAIQQANPEGAALRGKWVDIDFLADVTKLNPQMKNAQLQDYHGHGWLYRKVWKKDRKGNLLDAEDRVVAADDPKKFEKAVHLADIHADRGMHCVDCHFTQDVHGDGRLYGEPRAATEIMCIDCHGTLEKRAGDVLRTSGNTGGNDLSESRVPFGANSKRFFKGRDGVLYQRSQLDKDVIWAVPQIADAVDPANAAKKYGGEGIRERAVYNEKARYAKTVQKDGVTWGSVPAGHADLAHSPDKMTCQACHTSWTTACFGCHLPMQANMRKEIRHYEGGLSRNWTSYNYQVLRDDAYMLGIDGSVTGNKVSPVRSACAVVVGSQNQNREWLYSQQQTISAEGFSGQAFSTYVPHTVRGRETKQCTDCHLSEKNDNNAWMAQLLLHGTNYVNFMGRYVYVACGDKGFEAIAVTERDEPQAVIGSTLHRDAFPERFQAFVEKDKRKLSEAYHHGGRDATSIQLRGEYCYVAEGTNGMYVYDVANVDNKGFSERITTSLNSPLGQRFYVRTKNARAVASPTTLGVDPTRPRRPENEEQAIHPLYAFLYVADREEGLVMVLAATLLDGDPANNFLGKTLVFNPDGMLDGAETITIAGNYAYVGCKAGLVILDLGKITLADPTPRVAKVVPELKGVTSVAVQFRYAFVTTYDPFLASHGGEGRLHVVDVTDPAAANVVPNATVKLQEAHDIYVARTYAFVSAGKQGLVIVDVENPEKPKVDQTFDAGGAMNDVRCCRVAMTNASLFAYVADGKNGLRVVQLTSPETVPEFGGFSPRVKPELIATYPTHGPALSISKPLDRDRAVDESGNQLAVFGRIGARPFNGEEQQRLYIRDGKLFRVSDAPKRKPMDGK
jgi:hypothetical protein